MRVRNLSVKVEGPGKSRQIFLFAQEQFPLQQGQILNQGEYENGKKRLINIALGEGFVKARFTVHVLRINRQTRQADIRLVLDTGPQFVFGETTFEQQGLRTQLLQRYLPYRTGDPYRPAKLTELRNTLYRTDYFSNVVVEGRLTAAKGLAVPVIVRLGMPEHLNRYSFGLGYATDTGPRVKFKWHNRLLNTRGHKLRGSAQVSQYENTLGLNYDVPLGNPRYDQLEYRVSYNDQTWNDTDTKLFTIGTGLSHNGELVSYGGSIDYRDEKYSVGVTEGHSQLFLPTLTGNLIWADNLLDTHYGLEITASVSGADEYVGSDVTFIKGTLSGKVILTLMPRWRLIGRGDLGATAVNSIDELPPSLRFYTGGDQSIRGYAYKSIGPTDSSGTVVGGRYLVVGSLELERQVAEDWSVAAFWDVGNAFNDFNLAFKQGAGVGVRYRLPFGQIRVDVASAIVEGGFPLRLHLSVGADL